MCQPEDDGKPDSIHGFDITSCWTFLAIRPTCGVMNQGIFCQDKGIVYIDHWAGSFT